MTGVLTAGLSWRAGYFIVGALLLLLALAFALTRQLWVDPAPQAEAPAPARGAPLLETLRLPMTWLGILLFFVYTGAEVGVGNWVFSLLTEERGVSTEIAGTWVSLYWASLTLGRIVFGVVVGRVSPTTLLRGSMIAAAVGALMIWLNFANWLTFGGIALMGIAFAPQFPLLISATPGFLGARHADNGVGLEVASASVGGALLPSLIGVLAAAYGLEVLGPSLLVMTLAMAGLFELLARRMR
jgi:fucose permease